MLGGRSLLLGEHPTGLELGLGLLQTVLPGPGRVVLLRALQDDLLLVLEQLGVEETVDVEGGAALGDAYRVGLLYLIRLRCFLGLLPSTDIS